MIEVGKTWDWSSYADHFTEDAKYVEHALGNMEGRENIREWIVSTMNTFPGSEMPVLPGGVVLDRHRQGLGHLQEHQHA